MNESLIKAIKSTMSSQLEKFTLLKKEYEMVKKTEPTNIQAQNEIAIKAHDVLNDYNTTKSELAKYGKTPDDVIILEDTDTLTDNHYQLSMKSLFFSKYQPFFLSRKPYLRNISFTVEDYIRESILFLKKTLNDNPYIMSRSKLRK